MLGMHPRRGRPYTANVMCTKWFLSTIMHLVIRSRTYLELPSHQSARFISGLQVWLSVTLAGCSLKNWWIFGMWIACYVEGHSDVSLTISSYGYWNMIRFSTLAAIMKRVTMGVVNRGLICAKSSQNTASFWILRIQDLARGPPLSEFIHKFII